MTDLEQLHQLVGVDLPFTVPEWEALAQRFVALMGKAQNQRQHGGGADGTINAATWGHLRNIGNAVRDLAWALSAAERGDDPDIPF